MSDVAMEERKSGAVAPVFTIATMPVVHAGTTGVGR
jgi:hypothetical protein